MWENLLKRLVDKQVIMPHLELAMLADKWPDKYVIEVDSSPYYGHGDGMFHPSTHPLMGVRELYYRFHPATRGEVIAERRTMTRQMTLAVGSAFHAIVQTQLQMAGLLTPENIEVEYTIPEHHVRGRIDFITNDGLVGEMKTGNSRKFAAQEVIQPSWDAQLSLNEFGVGKDEGVLLMMEAGYPWGFKEFPHKRNDKLLEEIFTKFDHVRECIAANTPPRPCCLPDSSTMQACAARYMCWLSEDPKLRPD